MTKMFIYLQLKYADLKESENGATAIEYGLIAAAVGLTLATVMPTIASSLEQTFQDIASGLKG